MVWEQRDPLLFNLARKKVYVISAKEQRLREYLDTLSHEEGLKFCTDWIAALDNLASIGLDVYELKEKILDGLDYVKRKPEISGLAVYVETEPVCESFLGLDTFKSGTNFPDVPVEIANKQYSAKFQHKYRGGKKHHIKKAKSHVSN